MQDATIRESLSRLDAWVQKAEWKGYDTFDGLSSPLAKYFTFNNPLLKQFWQQGIRRCSVNLRPLLGIKPGMSTKGMGFFAQGYLHLHKVEKDPAHLEKAKFCLEWLMKNNSKQFKGYCWGNHFDYQSRGGNISKGTPTIVWTGLIGHAFLDAFDALGDSTYFDVAQSACDFIVKELGWQEFPEGFLLRYYPDISSTTQHDRCLLAHRDEAEREYRDRRRAIRNSCIIRLRRAGKHLASVPWAWIDLP
jgi:hypothetical protein